ncbi:pyrroline-5-carboxylate reductase [compost metagenome]
MKIVCIGSGNVATHMANAFKENEADIVQVWSKDFANAVVLAGETGAQAVADLKELDQDADLYLIAVKDDAIVKVVKALKDVKGLVVHTSGATEMEVLAGIKNYGVFYPLQTFSKAEPIDFIHVPLCLEASSAENLSALRLIAVKLSPLIYEVNTQKRKTLHLAGVFACNFVNHMYRLSQQIIEKHDIDFEILRPLIMETAVKVQNALPENVQTGPAIRNDKQTILKHEELLQKSPHLKEIYTILSNSIKKTR